MSKSCLVLSLAEPGKTRRDRPLENTRWNTLLTKEGVNQGCPLSPIFATLVLHRALTPIDKALQQRAKERLHEGNTVNDDHGGISHLFAYMDDISATIPLEDVKFFLTELQKLGSKIGCFINPFKTHILTSCNGESILPLLNNRNPSLATEIEDTINRFSIKEGPDNKSIPVKLTQGFRLLGTPVGSRDFANKYYHDQLTMVTEGMQSLLTQIDDQQTRLKLFSKCTIQKLPHLLASDTMHNLDISEPAHDWYNYNGSLVSGIDTITKQFFNALLHQEEDLPTYATLIAHLSTKSGGLGIINASLRAAPDFVLTTMMSKRRATQGFLINKDLRPIKLHSSITDLWR
jgi:hypothetical protein